jgi:hypothetical protein
MHVTCHICAGSHGVNVRDAILCDNGTHSTQFSSVAGSITAHTGRGCPHHAFCSLHQIPHV